MPLPRLGRRAPTCPSASSPDAPRAAREKKQLGRGGGRPPAAAKRAPADAPARPHGARRHATPSTSSCTARATLRRCAAPGWRYKVRGRRPRGAGRSPQRTADLQLRSSRMPRRTCRAGATSTGGWPTTSSRSSSSPRHYPALVEADHARRTRRGSRAATSSASRSPQNAADVADGKPIFLNMGVHHAREWPSAEHPMEFAYDLLRNYGHARAHDVLVSATRTIIGADRQPGRLQHLPRGAAQPASADFASVRLRDEAQELPPRRAGSSATGRALTTRPGACAASTPTATTAASGAAPARARTGRPTPTAAPAPFSEPEVQNIRELSRRGRSRT